MDLMTLLPPPRPLWTCGNMITINNFDKCGTQPAMPGAKTGHKGRG